MGKKSKIGKARKDKFYQLAKETGYRSRAAFKLLQLNRKYSFLERSRVVVDLCAAPGGWLQVAAQHTPMSSIVIGIDLVSIAPIAKTTTLQEDITTSKCRESLKKALQTWKADCFLNDGAGNVGKNWLHDAFAQAQLTLHALRLATEFLRKGGWFVTKVFRSRDYQALLNVFEQLFNKVHATKPQASRNESAEIFVVCQGYNAPQKVNRDLLDPKKVFSEPSDTPVAKPAVNLFHPEKQKRNRSGYAEGDYTLHHTVTASQFFSADDFLQELSQASEIKIDDERIAGHVLTTDEVRHCCADIKVLGRRELKLLIQWRYKILKDLTKQAEEQAAVLRDTDRSKKAEQDESSSESDVEKTVERELSALNAEEKAKLKRTKRIRDKERQRLKIREKYGMAVSNVPSHVETDTDLFALARLSTKQDLTTITRSSDPAPTCMSDDELGSTKPQRFTSSTVEYNRDDKPVYDEWEEQKEATNDEQGDDELLDSDDDQPLEFESEVESNDSLSEEDDASADDSASEEDNQSGSEKSIKKRDLNKPKKSTPNPLIVPFERKSETKKRTVDNWFSRPIFQKLNVKPSCLNDLHLSGEEDGNDIDDRPSDARKIERHSDSIRQVKSDVLPKKKKQKSLGKIDMPSKKLKSSEVKALQSKADVSMIDVTSNAENMDADIMEPRRKAVEYKNVEDTLEHDGKASFEIVKPEKRILDPVELALGAKMAESKKSRREVIEAAFNRYAFNDDNLPSWFVEDERKHNQPQLPITKSEIDEYRMRQRALDARPIKKIAEAKARKKSKALKRLEKVRKKAALVTDQENVTDREKWQQIQSMYKKAGLLKKKKPDVTYVMAKKGGGKRVSRPAGVKGRYKVVDRRLKKDVRSMKRKGDPRTKGRKTKGHARKSRK